MPSKFFFSWHRRNTYTISLVVDQASIHKGDIWVLILIHTYIFPSAHKYHQNHHQSLSRNYSHKSANQNIKVLQRLSHWSRMTDADGLWRRASRMSEGMWSPRSNADVLQVDLAQPQKWTSSTFPPCHHLLQKTIISHMAEHQREDVFPRTSKCTIRQGL